VTEQPASGTVAGDIGAHGLDAQTGALDAQTGALDAQTGPSYVHEAHHGRPASWVTTCIVVIGFLLGGIALCVGPAWWLFWTGAAIVVLGVIVGAAVHIFDDWY
jgi:hypothetical protein